MAGRKQPGGAGAALEATGVLSLEAAVEVDTGDSGGYKPGRPGGCLGGSDSQFQSNGPAVDRAGIRKSFRETTSGYPGQAC